MSDAITTTEKKSWIENFVAKARGDMAKAPPASPASYMRETGSTLGEYTAGGIVGSVLGGIHGKWGLDTKGGPIDGLIAGLGAVASVGLSGHFPEAALYARKLGGYAFNILAFRKGYEAIRHAPLAGGVGGGVQRVAAPGKGPGIAGEDPIEKVAKDLG